MESILKQVQAAEVMEEIELVEVDTLMRKIQGMKMILAKGLDCRCSNLDECIDCIIQAEASS